MCSASPVDSGQASITSARPTQAESGKPPVSALPKQMRSGTTPAASAAKRGAGAVEAGVDLVKNQQRAVLVARTSERGQEPGRREHVATTTLRRLNEDRADLPRREGYFERACEVGGALFVRVGNALHPLMNPPVLGAAGEAAKAVRIRQECGPVGELRSKGRLEPRHSAGRKRAVAQPVIAVLEGEHSASSGGQHGRLECGLDGVRAVAAEDHFAGASEPATKRHFTEALAEAHFLLGRVDVAHRVQEPARLRRQRTRRRPVPERGHGEGRGKVEEAVSVGVPHVHALRQLPKDGKLRVDVGDIAGFRRAQPRRQRT